MYLTVGSGSNVDAGEDPMRAAVHRYNPDGSGHETFVSGTRNVIGLRWYPGTETLWGAVAGARRAWRRSRARLLHGVQAGRLLRLAVRLHRAE